MLNENRVILMARMASYEQKEGRRCMAVTKYFRTDFVLKNIIKGIIYGTIAFVVGLALYIIYGFEEFMENIYKMDLFAFAKEILMVYAGFMAVYCVILYIVSTVWFLSARKSLKCYYQNLKKLKSLYEEN